MEPVVFVIKHSVFSKKTSKLTIDKQFIRFEDSTGHFIQFDKLAIKDYRYGIKWIRGFEFTVGRVFQIFIRNQQDQLIKISFNSFYGIRKKENHQLYVRVLNALWQFYFDGLTDRLLEKFNQQEEFSIANVLVNNQHIEIKTAGLTKEASKQIVWDRVGTSDYQTYFAIYDKGDVGSTNRTYSYLNDWNTTVLYSVIRSIARYKQQNIIEETAG